MPDANKWAHSLSVSNIDENYDHDIPRLVLIASSVVVFAGWLVLNAVFYSGVSLFGVRLFAPDLKVPAPFSSELILAIWILVCVWQAGWLAYGLTTLCRKSSSDFLYKYPPVMHWIVYFNFIMANTLYLIGIAFWSRHFEILSLIYLALTSVSLYIGGFVSLFKLFDYQREMHYTEKVKDVWSVRILVQNGLFLYASGVYIIFLSCLHETLATRTRLDLYHIDFICLALLVLKLVIYFSIESVVWFHYCKFLFTPWLMYAGYVVNMIVRHATTSARLRTPHLYQLAISTQFEPVLLVKSTQQQQFHYLTVNNYSFFHYFSLFVILVLFVFKLVKLFTNDFYFCFRQSRKNALYF